MINRLITSLLASCTILCCSSPKTDDKISGAIAYTLGNDTTMVQEFSFQNNELTQTWIQRTPEVQVVTGTSLLNELGNILSLKASYFKPTINGELILLYSSELSYKNDSTYISYSDEPEIRAFPGYIMTTNLMKPIGMFWHVQMAYFAPKEVGSTLVNKHLIFKSPIDFRLTRTSQNEVTVGSAAMGQYRVILDNSGIVTAVDGTASSFNFKGIVVDAIDIHSITKRFLRYEIANGKLSSLTGKDQVTGLINDTNISIQYGRPFQRGRKIFGGIVPWDSVWRTGANAATKMTLDGPLTLGEADLEQGEYSLWSIPHEDGTFDLVINSQSNIWGTNHDSAYDLHIIPMIVRQIETSTERFTISLEDDELALEWGDIKAAVQVR